eukprot:21171-Rhodomonas_salina.1
MSCAGCTGILVRGTNRANERWVFSAVDEGKRRIPGVAPHAASVPDAAYSTGIAPYTTSVPDTA